VILDVRNQGTDFDYIRFTYARVLMSQHQISEGGTYIKKESHIYM